MADRSPASIIGCLLDGGGSADLCLGPVFDAALRLAEKRLRQNSSGLFFVGIYGLNNKDGPSAVDLYSLAEELLKPHEWPNKGRDALIERTNKNDLRHVSEYIEEQHEERVAEFRSAVPSENQMLLTDTAVTVAISGLAASAPALLVGLGPVAAVGAVGAGFYASRRGPKIAMNHAVNNSKAFKLVKRILQEWWASMGELVPRPVQAVVDLLRRLKQESKNYDWRHPEAQSLLARLYPFIHGPVRLHGAVSQVLSVIRKQNSTDEHSDHVLVLVSDGMSKDSDPSLHSEDLHYERIKVAAVHLSRMSEISVRSLPSKISYEDWDDCGDQDDGEQTLLNLTSITSRATHPIPALLSMGWDVPKSGECKLCVRAGTATVLDEFFAAVLSARPGSADGL